MRPGIVILTIVVLWPVCEVDRAFADELRTPPLKSSATSQVESGYARIGKSKLYYEVLGDGHPLVLIHGGYLDRRMWDGHFELFAKRFRVVRYDVRGHGLSRNARGDYYDHEDLHALLTHLKIDKACIVGLSMGGQIAIDFALQYPDMVTALVPVAPGISGYEFPTEQLTQSQTQFMTAYRAGDLDQAIEFFLQSWTDGPQRKPEEVAPAVRERAKEMLTVGIPRIVSQSGRQMLDPPAIGRLHEIHVPTLCIVGDLDMPDISTIVDMLASEIPGAQKAVVTGVAHMVNMERPDEFNRILLDFLQKQGR